MIADHFLNLIYGVRKYTVEQKDVGGKYSFVKKKNKNKNKASQEN